jgi:hypothetical protein
LNEAGFAAGPDAVTSFTSALAAKQLAASIEIPASDGVASREAHPAE